MSREAGEERELRDALGLEVSKIVHSVGKQIVQIFIFYMSVGTINAVHRCSTIGHLVGVLEPLAVALATTSPLTTVSFCIPRNYSKSITASVLAF